MRGRKPQPSRLKLLRGLPGKRKLSVHEPAPAPLKGSAPPDWLDPAAQAEWVRLAPMLERLGVLTESDTDALAAYCVSWTKWKSATQQLWKWGMVLKAKEGEIPVVSPYMKIATDAQREMRAFLVEFGMTPSARARVHVTQPDAGPVSKWAGELK